MNGGEADGHGEAEARYGDALCAGDGTGAERRHGRAGADTGEPARGRVGEATAELRPGHRPVPVPTAAVAAAVGWDGTACERRVRGVRWWEARSDAARRRVSR